MMVKYLRYIILGNLIFWLSIIFAIFKFDTNLKYFEPTKSWINKNKLFKAMINSKMKKCSLRMHRRKRRPTILKAVLRNNQFRNPLRVLPRNTINKKKRKMLNNIKFHKKKRKMAIHLWAAMMIHV